MLRVWMWLCVYATAVLAAAVHPVRASYWVEDPNKPGNYTYPGYIQPIFPCQPADCWPYWIWCYIPCPIEKLIPSNLSDPYYTCTVCEPGLSSAAYKIRLTYWGDSIICPACSGSQPAPPPPSTAAPPASPTAPAPTPPPTPPPEPSTGGGVIPFPLPIPPQDETAVPWPGASTGGSVPGSTGGGGNENDLPPIAPEPVHPFPYGTYNASDPSNTLHWMVGSSLNDYGGDPNALIREDCNTAILLAELWCDHYYSIEAQQQAWYMCFTDVLVDYMGFTSNTLPINYTTAYYDLSKDERVGPSWATILGTVLNPFASVADLIDDFLNDLRDDTNGRLTWWSEYTAFATGLSFQVNYVTVTNTSATLATSSWVYRGDWSIEQAVDVAVFTWRPVATEQTADIHETVSVAAAVLTYEAELWNKNDGALRQSILNMLGAAVQYRINSLPGLPT